MELKCSALDANPLIQRNAASKRESSGIGVHPAKRDFRLSISAIALISQVEVKIDIGGIEKMSKKFAKLVTALEKAGIIGHDAYEMANQVDLGQVPDDEIESVARELSQEDAALLEALRTISQEDAALLEALRTISQEDAALMEALRTISQEDAALMEALLDGD